MATLVNTENYIRLLNLEKKIKSWADELEGLNKENRPLQKEVQQCAGEDIISAYKEGK